MKRPQFNIKEPKIEPLNPEFTLDRPQYTPHEQSRVNQVTATTPNPIQTYSYGQPKLY